MQAVKKVRPSLAALPPLRKMARVKKLWNPDVGLSHYAFKIADYAFEQCSKNPPIMLQLRSELSHYALNKQVQFYSLTLNQSILLH